MASPTTDRRYGLNTSVAIKAPCKAATTAEITLNGTQTIDGVAVVADDRVLVKNQSDTTENGIYVVATGDWSRDVDANGNRDLVGGTVVLVTNGTANGGTSWKLSGSGSVDVDTDAITFTAVTTLANADNMTVYELASTAAASQHDGIITGHIIRTTYYDTDRTMGSGGDHRYTGTTVAGKAGNWADADGLFYDADGKQFAIIGDANVLAFGALGDGSTDDSTAIQRAIVAKEAGGGGSVYFPASTYVLASGVTVTGASFTLDGSAYGQITLQGDGRGATKLLADSGFTAGNTMIQFGLAANTAALHLKESYINDMWLDGNDVDVNLLVMDFAERCGSRNVVVRNTQGNGLHILNGYDQQHYNLAAIECGGDGTHYGVRIEDDIGTTTVNNIYFYGARVESTGIVPGGGLIYMDGSNGSTRMADVRFHGLKLHGNPSTGNRADRPHFYAKSVKRLSIFGLGSQQHYISATANGSAVKLESSDAVLIVGTGITAADHDGNDAYFVELVDVDNSSIDGIRFTSNQTAKCIKIDANCSDVMIGSNNMFGNETPVDAADAGVWNAVPRDNSALTELTISSGSITVRPDKSYYRVDTEGDAASDDLDTMAGGFTGQIVTLQLVNAGRNVVAKDGTGNLALGADFTLDILADKLMLIYNGSTWDKIANASN